MRRSIVLSLVGALCLAAGPCLRAEDCNGNGVSDEIDIRAATSEDCNEDLVPDECETLPLRFAEIPHLASAGVPLAVTTGDFNSDGITDFASASSDSDATTISVFLGVGGGDFVRTDYPGAERGPSALKAGDLDGDGDGDLVLLSSGHLWALDNAGDGSLAPPREIDTTRIFSAFELGDVSGDGRLDLIAVRASRDLAVVFTNAGQGGRFGDPVDVPVGDLPIAVTLGDIDGDGDLDMATANRGSGDLSLLINEGAMFELRSIPLSDGTPRTVTARDLNADGRADLMIGGGDDLEILLSGSDGSFETTGRFDLGGEPGRRAARKVVATDIDSDGDVDLAVSVFTVAGVVILTNQGGGLFTAARPVPLSESPADFAVSGDINGDGRADLVSAMESTRVITLLLSEGGREKPGITFSREKSTVPIFQEPHGLALGDMDGDGDLDAITANGVAGSVSLLVNEGRGRFSPRLIDSLRNRGFLNTIAAVDLEGDGDLDIVTASIEGQLYTLANDGAAGFGPPRAHPAAKPFFITVENLNADGRPDVVAANQDSGTISLIFNRGLDAEGDFAFGGLGGDSDYETVAVGSGPVSVATGDLDGDGRIDLAVANYESSELSVLFGDGSGGFPDIDTYDAVTPKSVVAVDLDGDGDLDLAVAEEVSGQVSVYANRGDGSFDLSGTFALAQTPYSLTAADLNRDGRIDIVTANATPNSVSVLLNTGGNTLSAPFQFPVGVDPRYVVTADLDEDGQLDLLVNNHTSKDVTLLFSRGTETPSEEPFLERICTELDLFGLSAVSTGSGPIESSTKYIVPASRDDPELLPSLFQNVGRFPLHQEFLAAMFPERFPVESYEALVGRRESRRYFVGVVNLLRTDGGPLYGFNVITSFQSDPAELPRAEEVRGVYETLEEVFTLRPLVYAPDAVATVEDAASWGDPGFPVFLGAASRALSFEAYTSGIAYGFVRRLVQAEFNEANDRGAISFRDLLVLDRAPRDIEGVVAGVITAEPQGVLSHLAIRTSRRGTPNAFLRSALDELAPYDAQLVRLEVTEDGYSVEPATLEEAREWWDSHRPRLSKLPVLDPEFAEMPALDEIAALESRPPSPEAPPLEARFGGKASHFARLQQVLTGEMSRYREQGFAIPVHYYLEFMRSNRMRSAIDPSREVTYTEYIEELAADDEFSLSSTHRFAMLESFRDQIRESGQVPEDLVRTIATRTAGVFGTTTDRVRFRSSSNVEDALEFNGAGLYDSTSVCAADDLDANRGGPSHCDPERDDERGVARGLKKVWASLWNFRAYEERAFYGIPVDRAAMGILVTRAFIDERANGVAFTGSPSNPLDRRYVVTAQVGENSVVAPEPGEIPEKDLVWIENGELAGIERAARSSLVDQGSVVLSDAQLEEIGSVLWHIEREFPVDTGAYPREQILLDVEFKVTIEGLLAVKQVRPFLLPAPIPPTPTFELEVPSERTLCGAFVPFRSPREAYELKSRVRFGVERMALPTRSEWFRARLFDVLELGPARELAAADEPGIFHVTRIPRADRTVYRFDYEQRMALPSSGETIVLTLSNLRFESRGDEPIAQTLVLDDEFFTRELILQANSGLVTYSSCGYVTLPLWETVVELEDGSRIELLERHEPPATLNDTGPGSLIRADVQLAGAQRTITDYWDLVYAADRHNLNVRYWVVFEAPLRIPEVPEPVRGLEVVAPEPKLGVSAAVRYLNADFEVIASPAVSSFSRTAAPEQTDGRFRRGDIDGDGKVTLTDAVQLLTHLFRAGGTAPPCAGAADANDDGALNLSDAVTLLERLFGGLEALPPPFEECGLDPTEDELGACRGVCL